MAYDSCQKRFLGIHKDLHLVQLHSLTQSLKLDLLRSHSLTQSLVLYSKDLQRCFLKHMVSKTWILFFGVSKQDPCFTVIEEDGTDKETCTA